MVIREKTFTVFECNVCGYEWTSKKYDRDNPPIYCSKCKSAAWDRRSNIRGTFAEGKIFDKE